VNFIKNGWINRNRLLFGQDVKYFTIPLSGGSSFAKINQVKVQAEGVWRKKIADSVRFSYGKSPYFPVVFDLFSSVLFAEETSIASFAARSVMAISEYLGLETEFIQSSTCYDNNELKGVDRVIDICRREGATQYLNLPGGKDLYDEDLFRFHGIALEFIDSVATPYPQNSSEFVPNLSIIDVAMFNDCCAIREMLSAKVSA